MNTPNNLTSLVLGVAVGVVGAVTCAFVMAVAATRQEGSGLLNPGAVSAKAASDPSAKTLVSAAHSPPSFSAMAVGVGGGDGLTVIGDRDRSRVGVRLWGVDAPELDQPMGREAEEYLRNLTADRKVFVQPIAGVDNIGFVHAKVYVDGKLLNEQVVRGGMAWAWAKGSDRLIGAQGEARAVGRGLWGTKDPIAPWDWRKGVR